MEIIHTDKKPHVWKAAGCDVLMKAQGVLTHVLAPPPAKHGYAARMMALHAAGGGAEPAQGAWDLLSIQIRLVEEHLYLLHH